MKFSDYEFIDFRRRGRVLSIVMNAPKTKNAINERMHYELARAFNDADDDPESDVLVFTGAGDAFSAGGDILWMKAMLANRWLMEVANKDGRRAVFSMLECEKPLIAKVRGPAIGLGATLALFCDVVFASANAKFSDPHVQVGLVAGDGGAVIWPHLLGHARAKEYLMTGDAITAAEAERIGLINHCVPEAELDGRVDAFADRLAGGALKAIRWTKQAINAGLKPTVHSVLNLSFAYELSSGWTDDHREAVEAFAERRKPTFRGR
jgi:enoyl-CoA hydratase